MQTPLLRVVPVTDKKDSNKTIGIVYDFPLFFKLKSSNITTIDILITSSERTHSVALHTEQILLKCVTDQVANLAFELPDNQQL